MIRILRISAPQYLNSQTVKKKKKSLSEKAAIPEDITENDLVGYWRNKAVKDSLFLMHNGKCCFCERKRDRAREPDVEHYRPKGAVKEDQTHPGYWWLAYEWDNLLWSCKACNEDYKKIHFPVANATRARSEADDLSSESPLLLNPCSATINPESCITYDWEEGEETLVTVYGKDREKRGDTTINILGLNRLDLMKERGNHLKVSLKTIAAGLRAAIEINNEDKKAEFAELVKCLTSSEYEFAGFARAYFTKMHLAIYVSKT